ncbi:MAG TPA: hypothetical protein VGC96_10780 [Candidatus Elarobacter sp.]
MTARAAALAVAAITFALVVAQDLVPATPLYHTWQYALALTAGIVVMLAYARGARRGDDGSAGKRLLPAVGGAVVAGLAGLASGLLGPDTASVIGTPGTVTPLGALGAAAFSAPAGPDSLERGSADVTLRRRNASEIVVAPGRRRLAGESIVYLEPRPAAYVDAFDARGAHLTVTRPASSAFLSPVLLFREHQRIGQFDLPFDTFATPARHRVLRAIYFTPGQLRGFAHAGAVADPTRPAVILTASDDAGKQLGITLASSGRTVEVGGIRVRLAIGTYPALAVAAAPATWALIIGGVLFVAGIAWSAAGSRSRAGDARDAVADPDRSGGGDRRIRRRSDDVEVS